MMKKILVVVLTVCVVFGTAAAFAQGHQNHNKNVGAGEHHNQQQMMCRPQLSPKSGDFRPYFKPGFRPCRPEGKKPNFTPDMPTEIREKAAELAKLRVDLEEAMTSRPVNKTKALETYKKMQLLENEIDVWRFEKRLEKMEAMKKHHEEKHKAFMEKMEKHEHQNEAEPEK